MPLFGVGVGLEATPRVVSTVDEEPAPSFVLREPDTPQLWVGEATATGRMIKAVETIVRTDSV
jgi:hypothetical protein